MSVSSRRRAAQAIAAAMLPLRGAATRRDRRRVVGPGRDFPLVGDAVAAAEPGGSIEIKAADCRGDVAVLQMGNVRIVGTGGRPRRLAAGTSAEGKLIFVVRARGIVIENLEVVCA